MIAFEHLVDLIVLYNISYIYFLIEFCCALFCFLILIKFFMFIYLFFYSTIFDSLYWYSYCDYTMFSLIAIYVSYSKNRPIL